MQKTPALIQKKREIKFRQLKEKTELSHKNNLINLKLRLEKNQEQEFLRQKLKRDKKKQAYLKKKQQEYERKCKNEIRVLEGKPEKVYAPKKRTRNHKLDFALQIAQENAKLRDTDQEGRGHCCSCWIAWERRDFAWGHRISRMVQSVCLRMENINAQCHKCNQITWPLGNVQLKLATQKQYRDHLVYKYGEERVKEIEETRDNRVMNPKKYTPSEAYIEEIIPELIKENEELRKTKTFQISQRKNRKKLYTKYFNKTID